MPHSIKHLFHIAAPRSAVFTNISSVEGARQWWTIGAAGSSGVGGMLEFSFGPHGIMKMNVAEQVPGERVVWKVLEGPEDWTGTTLTFALDENDGKTRVCFEHAGWSHNGDHYAASCFSWARYMESLRQLCQTGKGEGHGTPGYRKYGPTLQLR